MADPVNYDPLYAEFDSLLLKQIRTEAYGEDIGQHSWVTADELRADLERLSLNSESLLLDVGCGPGGPLIFAAQSTGCLGIGVDISQAATESASRRARTLNIDSRVSTLVMNLDQPLPIKPRSIDAVMSFDVFLHLHDRAALLSEIERVLTPGGRLLFTDPGVVVGEITDDEIQRRSTYGFVKLVPEGFNESILPDAGLKLLDRQDRSASVERNARGRLQALATRRQELSRMIGRQNVERQEQFLRNVIDLTERRILKRFMYLAESIE
jgi:cyclopropane fatty-acyl-phospholipid synthase-like methyltransferase